MQKFSVVRFDRLPTLVGFTPIDVNFPTVSVNAQKFAEEAHCHTAVSEKFFPSVHRSYIHL